MRPQKKKTLTTQASIVKIHVWRGFGGFTMRSLVKAIVCTALVCSFALSAHAQTPNSSGASDSQQIKLAGPRKQLATIIFAGLGGAVLGLSTLSFYGRPQDKLINIAIGGAAGIMAGTIYVTYRAATNPQELFGQGLPHEQFEIEQRGRFLSQKAQPYQLGLQYNF